MSADTTTIDIAESESPATILDFQLGEALSARAEVLNYLAVNEPKIAEARKALRDFDTVIELRVQEIGARRFNRDGWKGGYVKKKVGAAALTNADPLRSMLISIGEVPIAEIDDALPLITPPPAVKPDLRKTRKLADYGTKSASAIKAHIIEAQEREFFVIEPVEINVTGSATDAVTA